MTKPQNTIRKTWGKDPQLILISQNNINGGGSLPHTKELTGYNVRIGEGPTFISTRLSATPILYNLASKHS